jgi:hypothetical protein
MRRTNFGYGDKRALDLTPVSEMSLGKGGLFACGYYASGPGR